MTMDNQPWPEPESAHQIAVALVAPVLNVPASSIMAGTRGLKQEAQARFIAAYLVNVTFGISLTETGRVFGRDRCTIRHGARLVEDQRDDPAFDAVITALEAAAQAAMAARDARMTPGAARAFPTTPTEDRA